MNTELPKEIAIHPITLLSIVDHYSRSVGVKKNKRIVGALLGENNNGKLEVTNCYAIPFDEDPREQGVWFIDHNYHETMCAMFRKINVKEKMLGWYTTGVRYKPHDIAINELFRRYCDEPIMVLVDVEQTDEMKLPTQGFVSLEEIDPEGTVIKSWKHVPCAVEAFEAEEVGVEHLMRDVKNLDLDTLEENVEQKILSLRGLSQKLGKILEYIHKVEEGSAKINNTIVFNLQEILNLIPRITDEEKIMAFNTKTNDNFFSIYVASIVQSIIALHSLINNKLELRINDTKKIDEKATENEKEKQKGDTEKTTTTDKKDKNSK